MNSHVVFVVCRTCEGPSAIGLRAVIWPLACVCTNVNLANVGRGERSSTTFKRTFKWLFTYKTQTREFNQHIRFVFVNAYVVITET